MLMNPFFTIIIPTFNRSYCIGKAIESVLHQSFEDWELVIIDDGSTVDTKSVVLKYSDQRIYYYYKNHEERSAARNFGIKKAKGSFVCFLDSDDEYLSGFLELHYTAILKYPDYKIFRTGTTMRKDGTDVHLPDLPGVQKTFKDLCYNMNGLPSYCFNQSLLKNNLFDVNYFVPD